METYKIDQAQLPLGEPMLAIDFLVLYVHGKYFQNELLHHLPRDQGEIVHPFFFFPWVLLL